jgi:hypothetical protein
MLALAQLCAMPSSRNRTTALGPRIAQLDSEIANLTDAIASGMLRGSPALAQRLQTAEQELARLRSIKLAKRPTVPFSELRTRYVQMVTSLDGADARPGKGPNRAARDHRRPHQDAARRVGPVLMGGVFARIIRTPAECGIMVTGGASSFIATTPLKFRQL